MNFFEAALLVPKGEEWRLKHLMAAQRTWDEVQEASRKHTADLQEYKRKKEAEFKAWDAEMRHELLQLQYSEIQNMNRKSCLEKAADAVLRDRQKTHGSPEQNFVTIAAYWSIWLHSRGLMDRSKILAPEDVPAMMNLFKMGRLGSNITHPDNWVDIAGYSACGVELAAPDGCVNEAAPEPQLTEAIEKRRITMGSMEFVMTHESQGGMVALWRNGAIVSTMSREMFKRLLGEGVIAYANSPEKESSREAKASS